MSPPAPTRTSNSGILVMRKTADGDLPPGVDPIPDREAAAAAFAVARGLTDIDPYSRFRRGRGPGRGPRGPGGPPGDGPPRRGGRGPR